MTNENEIAYLENRLRFINKEKKEAETKLKSKIEKLFLESCKRGSLDLVKKCIQKKVNINIRSKEDGKTGLMLAAYYGQYNIVKYFSTQEHYWPKVRDKYGNEAIFYCILGKKPNLNIAKILIKAYSKRDIDYLKCEDGSTVLMCAAKQNLYSFVKLILENGNDTIINFAEKNLPDELSIFRGFSALMYASFNGNKKMINLLLRYGAKVNCCKDVDNGWTADVIAWRSTKSKIDMDDSIVKKLKRLKLQEEKEETKN